MALTLVTPPASLAALMHDTLVDHLSLGVDTGESPTPEIEDAEYVRALAEAAVGMVDGPDGELGRCLLNQTWRQTMDHCFPPIVRIVTAPVRDVVSVKYYDEDGILQTLDPAHYRVTGTGSWLTEIAPAYNESWPAVRWQAATVEVTFTAGYGDNLADVPATIIQAVRELVAHFYENRAAVERTQFAEVPLGVKALLAPFRVFRCPAP